MKRVTMRILQVSALWLSVACQNEDPGQKITRTAGAPQIDTYLREFGWITDSGMDSDGNLYVLDGAYDEVFRISGVDQSRVTVAGKRTDDVYTIYDGDGGPATEAHMNIPIGLAVHPNGDLYIADTGNNVIRKVAASTGIITTITGNKQGYAGDNGFALDASFFAPQDVAVASNGDVYLADTQNHVIRKITATTGIVTTVAGLGPDGAGYSGDGGAATDAALNYPTGVTMDTNGNIFIAEFANSVVRRVDVHTGIISTVCGKANIRSYTGDGGPADMATLWSPNKLSFDAEGNLLIADSGNSVIRKIDMATGIITTVAGSGKVGYAGDTGDAIAATLNSPVCVTADDDGNLFIGDQQNAVIRVVRP